MKMKTVTLVLVVAAAVILGTESALTNRKCMSVGLMCKSCSQVKLCTRNGTALQEEQIGTCNENTGSTCFNGECTFKENPICMTLYDTFNCQSVGYFPDPYNCQMYHHCFSEGDVIKDKAINCPDGFSYNTRSENCDTVLSKNKCESTLIPLCTTIGQHGTLQGDRSIYFICKMNAYNTLLPYLYKCPVNQVYDGYYGCY